MTIQLLSEVEPYHIALAFTRADDAAEIFREINRIFDDQATADLWAAHVARSLSNEGVSILRAIVEKRGA